MATTLPIFPTLRGIDININRTHLWDTIKADALSGKRTRYPNWTYPLYKYEVTFNFLRTAAAFTEWQQLEGFIALAQGPAQLWGWDDVNDDTATNQLFGVGDGVTKTFQLVRTLGGFTAPVFLMNGNPTFTVGGVGTAGTVSPYGQVTFAAAPAVGAVLQWTGMYYMPCRFDDDPTNFSQFASGFFEVKKLLFSSEKLP